MKLCRCAKIEGRDGCYRCLYAHQHQRELEWISRRRAVALFEAILSEQDQVKEVASLAGVNLDSLLESELERRFVTALRLAAEKSGWRWSETAFGGRQGFKIVIDQGLAWEIRPQVELGPAQGVARQSRPDFVLVPVGRETRRIAIFTDGFGFHAQPDKARARIEDDIAKRSSILDFSGSTPPDERHWVWSLTWTDVQTALGEGDKGGVRGLLANVDSRSFTTIAKAIAAGEEGAELPLREVGGKESFDLLIRWLADPDEAKMRRLAVTLGLAATDLKKPSQDSTAAEVRTALMGELATTTRALASDPKGTVFAGLRAPSPMLALHTAIPAHRLAKRDFGSIKLYLRLYDRQEERRAEDFEPAWRAFLQAWNLLQFHEVEVTSSERLLASGEEEPIVAAPRDKPAQRPKDERPPLGGDFAALLEDFEKLEPLCRVLHERDLPAPVEPEEDLVLGGSPRDVHLLWGDLKVALYEGADDLDRETFRKSGWTLFDPNIDDPAIIANAVAASLQRNQG